MAKKVSPPQEAFNAARFLPVLLILFAGSGCSALIYEIVWYQLLQLVIGSTAISLGVLLATFMGGLCLGSLLLPRYLTKKRYHPLRVYAAIEFGIGALGLLVLVGMPLIDGIYVAAVGHGMPAILFRAIICSISLLPPTLLMGASLPAIARWIETTPRGVSWLGLLYGGNTAGAVFGCLLAGFYLLRVFDLATATIVAALINFVVGAASYTLAKRTPEHSTDELEQPATPSGPHYWPVYATIAISGATALGAEVIWTRLMGLLLGATVYTFSIILAVFLVGIGIGSACRRHDLALPQTAGRSRCGAASARGRRGVDGLHAVVLAAELACESTAVEQSLVHLPDRPCARALDHPARHAALGREFPPGAGRGRQS